MDDFKNPEIVSNRLQDMRKSQRGRYLKCHVSDVERAIGAMRRTYML